PLAADRGELSKIGACSSGSKDHEVGYGIVGNSGPYIAAAHFPCLSTRPGLGRDFLQGLRFERLLGIARNRPEAPELFASVGVVGRDGTAHSVIGAVVAHEH